MLRESKRNNLAYRQYALAYLADYVETRKSIDMASEVYDITAPIIEESLAGPSEMDHDMQSEGLSSKTMYESAFSSRS